MSINIEKIEFSDGPGTSHFLMTVIDGHSFTIMKSSAVRGRPTAIDIKNELRCSMISEIEKLLINKKPELTIN